MEKLKLKSKSKSKFLNFVNKYPLFKKFYYFYNIYIRYYKSLKNGSQFGEEQFILSFLRKTTKVNLLILVAFTQQDTTTLIKCINLGGEA